MPTISFQPDRGTFTHSRLNSSGGLQVEIQFRGRASSVKSIANIRWNIQPALNPSKTIRVSHLRIYPASLISEFRIGGERGKPKGSDFVFSHLLSCSHSQLPHCSRFELYGTRPREKIRPSYVKVMLLQFIFRTDWNWLSEEARSQFSVRYSVKVYSYDIMILTLRIYHPPMINLVLPTHFGLAW